MNLCLFSLSFGSLAMGLSSMFIFFLFFF
jgi:hypothetical protein